MSLFEETMSLAVQLPQSERERLARALGIPVAPRATLNLAAPDPSKTNPAAWRAAQTGHAVLDVEKAASHAPIAVNATGADAIRGMWADLDLEQGLTQDGSASHNTVSSLPPNSPVLVHTSVVLALALGLESTRAFWEKPGVEIRLATATYLKLLEMCADESQRDRVRAFVQPFAVLSLGPMASTKAAQLMLESGNSGLQALDALIAATALAHEIPLLTRQPRSFTGIPGLYVATLP
ncbi:MAG TPA: PIN domain-containing protein [Abditibacterium sp.]|jgi:predicted nucleic acid-binding protein